MADLVAACERVLPGGPELVVRQVQPPSFARPAHGRLVQILHWEFGPLPPRWVELIDENADEHFAPSGDPVQRMVYAFSILHCLPAGRHGDHSAATGTVMRPATLAAYARDAGYNRVETLPIEHPMFRFYRLWS